MQLKSEGITIGYSNKKRVTEVIKSIELNASEGMFVCLLGKNGAGKSTLLKTLSGLQKPLQGAIFFDKKPLEKLNSVERSKRVSIVLTEKVQTSYFSVYELIALGRQPYTNFRGTLTEDDIKSIDFAMQQVGIKDLSDRRCNQLSDGQLQRVLIARAIAQDTPIIIFDEPTLHLDMDNALELFMLLKKMAVENNKLIITSTHRINLALKLASKIWLIDSESQFKEGYKTDDELKKSLKSLFNTKHIRFENSEYQYTIHPD